MHVYVHILQYQYGIAIHVACMCVPAPTRYSSTSSIEHWYRYTSNVYSTTVKNYTCTRVLVPIPVAHDPPPYRYRKERYFTVACYSYWTRVQVCVHVVLVLSTRVHVYVPVWPYSSTCCWRTKIMQGSLVDVQCFLLGCNNRQCRCAELADASANDRPLNPNRPSKRSTAKAEKTVEDFRNKCQGESYPLFAQTNAHINDAGVATN